MKNYVTAGDYHPYQVALHYKYGLHIQVMQGFKVNRVPISPDTVEDYELIDAETRTSAASAIGRGAIGAALLGPVGIAAALSAKKKGLYTIAIKWKDGKKSLIELDKAMYKQFLREMI